LNNASETTVDGIPLRELRAVESAPLVVVLPDRVWPSDDQWSRLVELAGDHNISLVAPVVRGSWWLDRVEPEFPKNVTPLRFVGETLVRWIRHQFGPDTPIGVLGVGRGGQGALQAAYRWPRELPAVAAIVPAIDLHRFHAADPALAELFPTAEAARQQSATLMLHPLNWPPHQWFSCAPGDPRHEGAERLASKLSSIGIPFTAELRATAPTVADYIASQLPGAVQFLAERLRELPVVPANHARQA
jgi:hypothetical protein